MEDFLHENYIQYHENEWRKHILMEHITIFNLMQKMSILKEFFCIMNIFQFRKFMDTGKHMLNNLFHSNIVIWWSHMLLQEANSAQWRFECHLTKYFERKKFEILSFELFFHSVRIDQIK